MNCVIYMFVLTIHVQHSYGAKIYVGALVNYYTINFDYLHSSRLYRCLANKMSVSCIMNLNEKVDDYYKVAEIIQQYDTKLVDRPQYKCSFTARSYLPGVDQFICSRMTLDNTSEMKAICSYYAFIIKWNYQQEFFMDDSFENCSLDSTTFAYRNASIYFQNTLHPTVEFISVNSIVTSIFGSLMTSSFLSSSTSLKPNLDSSTTGSTQTTVVTTVTKSNVIPITAGFIACAIVLAMLSAAYLVFRFKKNSTITKSDMKENTSNDRPYDDLHEENIYINTDIDKANYSTEDNIDATNTADILPASISFQSTHEVNAYGIELQQVTSSENVYSKLHEQSKIFNDVYGDLLS